MGAGCQGNQPGLEGWSLPKNPTGGGSESFQTGEPESQPGPGPKLHGTDAPVRGPPALGLLVSSPGCPIVPFHILSTNWGARILTALQSSGSRSSTIPI